jgi:hypothetical protein
MNEQELPQKVLNQLSDTYERYYSGYGSQQGTVSIQKYGTVLDFEFMDSQGNRIWKVRFRGI